MNIVYQEISMITDYKGMYYVTKNKVHFQCLVAFPQTLRLFAF